MTGAVFAKTTNAQMTERFTNDRPFRRDLKQERSLGVDRVYFFEIARVRSVPSVRTSNMLT
jgi:hypothetical protein